MNQKNVGNQRNKDGRNHFLDVLKGICIIFIVITHFAWQEEERLQFLFPFWIDMAVPVFMIISGYVYAFSYRKNEIVSMEKAYALNNVIDKIIRYTIPFLIALMLEHAVMIKLNMESISIQGIQSTIHTFLVGGIGPGSYYYPVMIQFIFTFPLIFFTIKSYKFKGVIICGIANGIYEVLQHAYGMNEECYRLLLFRYILLIAVGCYFSLYNEMVNRMLAIICEIVGIGFILLVCYTNYSPRVITYWTRTSFMAALYIIPIVVWSLKTLHKMKCAPLELLGKASYNIFLTQMVYYAFAAGYVGERIDGRALQLLANLAICLGVGVLFYYIETPLTKKIISYTKNKINTKSDN